MRLVQYRVVSYVSSVHAGFGMFRLYIKFVVKLNYFEIVCVVFQLKSDAREPFEKLDCSAVVKNVRISTLYRASS